MCAVLTLNTIIWYIQCVILSRERQREEEREREGGGAGKGKRKRERLKTSYFHKIRETAMFFQHLNQPDAEGSIAREHKGDIFGTLQ